MPRPCSICGSAAQPGIDHDILAGLSDRQIGRAHGVDRSAVARHRLNHVPAIIRRQAREAVERAQDTAPVSGAPELPALAGEAPSAPVTPRRVRGIMLDPAAPASGATVAPIPPVERVAIPAPIASPAADVLDLYQAATNLRDRALRILENAERDGDPKTALAAIREARGTLEHLSRLEERHTAAAPAVPLVNSPEWSRTRSAIIAALADHPEARVAVAEALVSTGGLA